MSNTPAGLSRGLFVGGLLAATAVPRAVEAQTTATLRVGAVPVESFAEAYYARDMGFFTNAGLDVEIQIMSTSSAIAAI